MRKLQACDTGGQTAADLPPAAGQQRQGTDGEAVGGFGIEPLQQPQHRDPNRQLPSAMKAGLRKLGF